MIDRPHHTNHNRLRALAPTAENGGVHRNPALALKGATKSRSRDFKEIDIRAVDVGDGRYSLMTVRECLVALFDSNESQIALQRGNSGCPGS